MLESVENDEERSIFLSDPDDDNQTLFTSSASETLNYTDSSARPPSKYAKIKGNV